MVSPYDADYIEWDHGNETELANHRITPEEVEQAYANGPLFVLNKRRRTGDRKMIGHTNGGRAIAVIMRWDADALSLRPITGWDCTLSEQSRYLK